MATADTAKRELETIKENIAKTEQQISTAEQLQESLKNAKGDKQALLTIQEDLNKVIGDTPGLINTKTAK